MIAIDLTSIDFYIKYATPIGAVFMGCLTAWISVGAIRRVKIERKTLQLEVEKLEGERVPEAKSR